MSALLLSRTEKDLLRLLFLLPDTRCSFAALIRQCREHNVASWGPYNDIDHRVELFIIGHLIRLGYVRRYFDTNEDAILELTEKGKSAVSVIGEEIGVV